MQRICHIIRENFKIIDSTHSWACQQAYRIEENSIILTTADEQSAGRGRFGKKWTSPPGESLAATFSFLIDPDRIDRGNISQVMALSASKMLKGYGLSPQVKWPNDILISEKKICGILGSAIPLLKGGVCMVISIGINVSMRQENLKMLGRPATSLHFEMGKALTIENVCNKLFEIFLEDLNIFIEKGFSPFLEAYQESICLQKNDKISFHMNGELIEGHFLGINSSGALEMRLTNGLTSQFLSGELFFEK